MCGVGNRIANPGNTPTLDAFGVAWSEIDTVSVDPGAAHRITLFAADAASAVQGLPVVDFAGQTQLMCVATFVQVEGMDISGGLASAFVQTPDGNGSSVTGTVVMAAAGHADNRAIAFFFHQANEATAPGSGWTELDDFAGSGPTRGFQTEYNNTGVADAIATWATSSPFVGLAAEIKATIAGGGLAQPVFNEEIQSVLFGGQVVH